VTETASEKAGLICADVRDHGGHSHPCGRDPDCPATAGECCDHCYWTMA
jgi:hypothetical protein